MTYAEVAEGVRAVIAAYCHAIDDGRTDDVVGLFCANGSATMPGAATVEGRDALVEAYAKWKPRAAQRHLVLNSLLTDWSDDEASAISDVVFIALRDGDWSIQMVGRYHDVLHRVEGSWKFHSRTITAASAP